MQKDFAKIAKNLGDPTQKFIKYVSYFLKCTDCSWSSTFVACSACDTGYYLRHDTKGCVTDCNSIGEYKFTGTTKKCAANCSIDNGAYLGING